MVGPQPLYIRHRFVTKFVWRTCQIHAHVILPNNNNILPASMKIRFSSNNTCACMRNIIDTVVNVNF